METLVTLTQCQLCGSEDLLPLGDFNIEDDSAQKALDAQGKSKWTVCANCCFIFQNPRFSREYQERWYEDSNYRKGGQLEIIPQGYIDFAPHQLRRFYVWLCATGIDITQMQNACCLDYGCGIGGALNFLAEKNNVLYGIELDHQLREFGNRHFKIKIHGRVSDLSPDLKFDFIFSHNALEHVYDPNDFFRFASERLKIGGLLILLVPAWRHANTLIALQEFNWSHNCMYDHVSMAAFMNKHGFFMASHLYQNPEPNGDWELCCVAQRSPRKNHFSFSVEEVIRELHVDIRKRSEDRKQHPATFPDKVSVLKC